MKKFKFTRREGKQLVNAILHVLFIGFVIVGIKGVVDPIFKGLPVAEVTVNLIYVGTGLLGNAFIYYFLKN